MLRQILWCLCLGTGSDPNSRSRSVTPSFNELKSLGALSEDKRLFSTPTWICEETCQSAGHEALSLRAGSENSFEFVIPC